MNPINSPQFAQIFPGQGLGPLGAPVGPAQQEGAQGTSSFMNYLVKSIGEVNSMQQEADTAVEEMFTGGDTTPAEVLSAVQKADIAFRLMIQVRNKMVQAYQEIKDIRV